METPTESTKLCAELHNALVRRVIDPSIPTRRDLVSVLQNTHPELYISLYNTQLLAFLSLIDNFEPPNGYLRELTPHVRQPHPAAFLNYRDNDIDEQYPEHVLLYPNTESGNEGGIIYDTATDLATWANFPPWPEPGDWVPLANILTKWTELWDTRKFYLDGEQRSVAIRSWVPADLHDALAAWTALTDSVAVRLPSASASTQTDNEGTEAILTESLLESAQVERAWPATSFATAFLSLAPRPLSQIRYIAPNISLWTSSSFAEVIEGESSSSPRRQYLSGRGNWIEEAPLLLFPSITHNGSHPIRVSDPIPPDEKWWGMPEPYFDKHWGFGKFTLDRRAGVYLYPQPEAGAGDHVVVLEENGRDGWGDEEEREWGWSRKRCYWGPGSVGRSLGEMLRLWREMVERGEWRVEEDGVVGVWR